MCHIISLGDVKLFNVDAKAFDAKGFLTLPAPTSALCFASPHPCANCPLTIILHRLLCWNPYSILHSPRSAYSAPRSPPIVPYPLLVHSSTTYVDNKRQHSNPRIHDNRKFPLHPHTTTWDSRRQRSHQEYLLCQQWQGHGRQSPAAYEGIRQNDSKNRNQTRPRN